jgi:AraC-like DNA-binding protein
VPFELFKQPLPAAAALPECFAEISGRNAHMKVSDFCSESCPQGHREYLWQTALSGLAKPHLRPAQAEKLKARVWSRETPLGIRMALIGASEQTLSFSLPGESDGIWIALLLEGRAILANSHQELHLGPDAIVHGPILGQATLAFDDDVRLLLVRFPRSALNTRLQLARVAIQMKTDSGMSRILSAILHAVAETIEDLPDDQERAIESMLREFVIATLAESAAAAANGGLVGVQAALLQKAYQIIEARLSDPELTMKQVCRELGVSLRYLYKLFARSGEGFGRYLKRRRLERCRCDLRNPTYAHMGISEICFRWGFNEAAHFSRVFREQFGMPPRTWRETAAAKSNVNENQDPGFNDRPTGAPRRSGEEAHVSAG